MTQSQMMMMMHQHSTMHPQSRRLLKRHIGKRKKKTTATTPTTATTTTSSSSSEPSLPHDIIFFHILPKLPVRCLLRFNCVSKLWYTTIHHDPNFHATQLSHAKSNPSLVAMLCQKGAFICFLQLLKEEGGGGQNPNNNNNNHNIAYLELDSGSGLIVGTCNGLTCNILPSGIQICNPSTRELLYFPLPKPTTHMEKIAAVRGAFGFDPLMKQYKVMNIRINHREYYDCRVYTLGTNNKWRNVTATCNYQPYCYPADLIPICISGTLFWRTNRMATILSFDLHHEQFQLIAGPKVPQGSILHTLFESEGGRLCLVYRYDDDLKDEVQLTLFTCTEDHQQLRLMHIASSSSGGGARWIRSGDIRLPLKPDMKLIQVAEFAKDIYLHWVTMDGQFILWDVNRKRWVHNKLLGLGLNTRQWVLLVNHAENLLSLKTFVPPSASGEVKYLSSRDAKHESPDGELKKKKRRRLDDCSLGYRATPYWLSIII